MSMDIHSHPRGSSLARAAGAIWRRGSRFTVLLGPVALIAAALSWPMLFTTSGLGGDWQHHLWYVWQQSLAIDADHLPSMFLNTHYSVFYPEWAFYGGTIYAVTGAIAVVLGDSALGAYILTYILGFMAAYGGWYWTGRILGLGRWPAHAPALVFVTSACYLTLVYGQGDWPEFLAVSMLPLMIAAGLEVLRSEPLRVLPAVALAGSSIVFYGSHILTVLWGSTLLAITCLAIVVLVPQARRQLRRRGLIRVGALVLPAVLVNAWFLSPMIAYASHTRIGSQYNVAYEDLRRTMHLVSFDHLFTLSRATTVRGLPDYALPLPTLVIAWVLVSIAILLWGVRRGAWLRTLLIIAAVTAGIVVLMTHAGLILDLPKPYTLVQFSYRMESYVLMGVTAAVAVILVLTRLGSARLGLWTWTIVPVLIVSLVGAAQQVNAYPHTRLPRDESLTPLAEIFAERYNDYAYVPLPFVSERGLPTLDIPPQLIHDNHLSLTVNAHPGQLAATNIEGGPNLLNITGATIVGADERSQLVLSIGSSSSASSPRRTSASAQRISIGPAQSAPVVLGKVLTLAGAAMLIIELVMVSVRRYRGSRRRRAGAQSGGSDVLHARERELQVEPVDFGPL